MDYSGFDDVKLVLRKSDFELFGLDHISFTDETVSVSNGKLFSYEEGGILGEVLYRLASAAPDNDGGGISDATDPDDDNDGIPGASDSSPFDANSTETESSKKCSGGVFGAVLFSLLFVPLVYVRVCRQRRWRFCDWL